MTVGLEPKYVQGRERWMSALPGGAADKLGNRYEAWWTLYRIADVLSGRASRIRLEPPGEMGVGTEFWVDEASGRWHEQAKDASAGGNWTLRRLIAEGVLPSLEGHLARGDYVRLVLSTPARDLAFLSSRARATETLAEYTEILTEKQRPELERLTTAWEVADTTAWRYLQRVHVEHHPPEQLRRLVHLSYDLLMQDDPDVVVNELRGWLDDMLHRTLTAPMIWAHLDTKGFARRLLAGEPTTVNALAATVARHHRRIDAARPALGFITQPAVTQLVDRLSAADGRQVVVLHGKAGSGKSTVAAEALRKLTTAGWSAAAVRMDGPNPASQSAAALGRVSDLSASPAVLLAGVAEGASAVLLVDQLDAVSTYSGRMPDNYDAVMELLEQTASLPNIKIVLVVRTVDLTADPRMRSLLSNRARVDSLAVGDLALDDVRTTLKQAGIDTAALAASTLQLLCVPLHLAVFSRLSSSSREAPYRTLQDLYEQFTAELRRNIEQQVGHLEWSAITGALVRFMSDHERLDAPDAVLDGASATEVAALLSRGVLVDDGGRVGFFHETYFDFLFARAFVATGRDLHDFLVETVQHLFRRAQARQVLEYLAANDRGAFHRAVVRLLTSDSVRTHLQEVVVTVLAQLDAEAEDWRVVEPLAFGHHKHGRRLAGLLSSPRWFDAADAAGRWEVLLDDANTVDLAAHQLVLAARQRPARVAALVHPHVGTSEAWRLRLRALVEWSLTPGLVDLAVELTERGDLDDARGPIAVNSDFWTIVYGIQTEDPAGAARLIGAYLRRAFARAEAEGSGDPFESGHLNPYSSAGGDSTICKIATAAPASFVEEVLPFVVGVVEATASATRTEYLRCSRRWGLRYIGARHGIDDAVFGGVEDALRLLGQEDPEAVTTLVRPLADSDIEELRFLICCALAAAGTGNDAIDWLLSDDRNFGIGWADSPRWASRGLIEVATRYCDDAHLNALTDRLLEYYPAWEKTVEARRWHGRAQYELLLGVEPSRRSDAVARRVAELERKFSDSPPAAPQAIELRDVESPVPQTSAEHLTDEDWTRAIRKYRSDKTDWSRDRPIGGATELARLLGARAESEPERFARLALTFDADTPPAHLCQVIEAVTGKVPVPLLARLCDHARRVAGQSVGKEICRAVEAVAADADDTLIGLLEQCATDDDPDHESARTEAGSGQFYGGDLLTAGLNCTRGAAARAVARLLFAVPRHSDRLMPTVVVLARDPIMAVRTQAAGAVLTLLNSRPKSAQDIAAELFDAPVDVLDSVTICRLLQVALLREPERFAPYLCRALDGPESVAERGGQAWATAFMSDVLVHPVPADLAGLCSAARRGAAKAIATNPAVAPQQLAVLFDDEDPNVRDAASFSMRAVGDLDAATAQALVGSFTTSAAYENHFDSLFFALNRSTHLLPEATITACERAIEVAGTELADIRTRHAATSDDVIAVVLRLYRQGNGGMRVRCLDAIDKLSELGALGLEQALGKER